MSKRNEWLEILGMLCALGTGVPLGMTGIYGSTSGTSAEESGGDFSDAFVESSATSSENPAAFTGLTAAGGSTIISAMTYEGGPDAIIEVFFKNQVPYTATEKRAEQVYEALHGTYNNVQKKPILIAESQEAVKAASQAFCGVRGDGIMDQLELFEELLESVADNQKIS